MTHPNPDQGLTAEMAETLLTAAKNVENARTTGIAEHLAGWEHLTMRVAVARLSSTAALEAEIAFLKQRLESADAELQQHRLSQLVTLMSDISEDCWCAGWISGNERALFRMAFMDGPRRYGMSEVREEDVARLRELAEQTGQWFYYDDLEGQKPISLEQFALQHQEKQNG